MMLCTKCKTEMVPIDSEKNPKYYYCPGCDSTTRADGAQTKAGTVDFTGVQNAMEFIDKIMPKDAPSEVRAVAMSLLSNLIYEQWFEGFKAGQMATAFFYRSKNDGENRTRQEFTNGEYSDGDRRPRVATNNREDSSSESPASGLKRRPERVREIIAGVEFEYNSHIKVPDNLYVQCARIADLLKVENVNNFSFIYDGHNLKVILSDLGDK